MSDNDTTRVFHATDAQDVLRLFDVHADEGLAASAVSTRREEHGPNQLRAAQTRKAWAILLDQFKSIVITILAVAAVAAFATARWPEGIALLAVTMLNTAIGFFSEWKAVRSMEALRRLSEHTTVVRRGGDEQELPAEELVPGDIVLIHGETLAPADIRLLRAEQLRVNEAALTGESVPVHKTPDSVSQETELAERTSLLYKGTSVVEGSGEGVVVATGMQTELGRISEMAQQAEEQATPLQHKLDTLGRRLVWITLSIAAVVAIAGLSAGRETVMMIETAIALGVAAVPEGLPIVATIALARGMYLMAKRNALVNRLTAVETLGATRIIFTDKTGTLTENRMSVKRAVTPAGQYDLDNDGDKNDAEKDHLLQRLIELGVLCNNAKLLESEDGSATGDPTEVALLQRNQWLSRANDLAGEGLRLLALADKQVNSAAADPYTELRFVGLVGMLDPPRSDISDAIEQCQNAGIRVIMVTGDRPDTGQAIGEQVGLADNGSAMRGTEISEWQELSEEDRERLMSTNVFARVTPEQKLNLVKLYQEQGEIVAMTGDGVNDAPALKQADIGVAMGKRGTDAAKQMADMVLRDDQFSTIVAAVRQGRIIFADIRKSVIFMLCTNLAEILVVTLASLAGAAIPLKPLQILFLNVLTDVFPALALGVGPGTGDVMQRPPRDPHESVLTRHHWLAIGVWSAVIGTCVLSALAVALLGLGFAETKAVTISFLTLAFGKLWFVLNLRDRGSPVWNNDVVKNPWIWGAVVLCTSLLLLAVYWAPLSGVLQTERPGRSGWLLVLGMSVIPALLGAFVPGIRFYSSARNHENNS